MLSPRDIVKEVASLIVDDNICYVHRTTREITSFSVEDIEQPDVAAAIAKIEEKIDKHAKVMPMSTAILIQGMEYFLDEVTDQSQAKELARGLKRKNPTRNFLQAVDSDMELKQHWRRYKKEHYQWYVEQMLIEAYNY